MVEVAEIIVHEADEPNLLADLLNADALAGEDGAEIDLLPIEADAPASSPCDASHRNSQGSLQDLCSWMRRLRGECNSI